MGEGRRARLGRGLVLGKVQLGGRETAMLAGSGDGERRGGVGTAAVRGFHLDWAGREGSVHDH